MASNEIAERIIEGALEGALQGAADISLGPIGLIARGVRYITADDQSQDRVGMSRRPVSRRPNFDYGSF